jgi:hypothetical protein
MAELPAELPLPANARRVTAAGWMTSIELTDGKVNVAGWNGEGAVGDGKLVDRTSFGLAAAVYLNDSACEVGESLSTGCVPVVAVNEVEANGTVGAASPKAATPTAVKGELSAGSDVDWFKVVLPAGKGLNLTLVVPAGKDYELFLYNAAGNTQLAQSIDPAGVAESIFYMNPGATDLSLTIKVAGATRSYSATEPYALKARW